MTGADLLERYREAENLTDRLAALRLLVHHGLDGADEALDRFYARYRDNPLVLDKWFAVQATAPSHAALDRVEALTAHPAFSFKNPNRVYALIRSFAAFNPVGFNRPDGAGYRFVAGVIADLDRQNPSVAARIATAFRSWRMLEPSAARPSREARSRKLQQSRAAVARPRRHPDPHAGRLTYAGCLRNRPTRHCDPAPGFSRMHSLIEISRRL